MVQLIVLLMLFLKSKSLFPKDLAGERKEILFVIMWFDRPGECSPEKDCCQ